MKPIQNYLFCIFSNLVPIYPVYLLLFEHKGLSLSEISLLLMIWSVPVVFLELPSGVLADRWSRKNLLLISVFLQAACFAVWFFADGFSLFAAGFVLWGVAEAMGSGAREALLFDSLKKAGQKDRFDRIYGRGEMFGRISLAAAMLLGGILTHFGGFSTALIVSVLSLLLSSAIVLGFTEVNLYLEARSDKDPESETVNPQTLRGAAVFLLGTPIILLPVLLSVLAVGMYGTLDEYDPAVASRYVPGVFFVALWGMGRFIFEGIGAEIIPKFRLLWRKKREIGGVRLIVTLSLLGALFLLCFALFDKALLIPLYGLYFASSAGIQVLIEDHIQQRIESQGRSTVHSIVSLAANLYGIMVTLAFSGLFAFLGIMQVLIVVSIYLLAVTGVIGFLIVRKEKTYAKT